MLLCFCRCGADLCDLAPQQASWGLAGGGLNVHGAHGLWAGPDAVILAGALPLAELAPVAAVGSGEGEPAVILAGAFPLAPVAAKRSAESGAIILAGACPRASCAAV